MKIVLSGTYSASNKGDAAMEISVAEELLRRVTPAPQIEILAPFPESDAFFYAPIQVRACNRRQLIHATFDLIRGAIWWGLGRSRVSPLRYLLLSSAFRITAESDLLVDLSGDMLTEDYGVHVAYSHYIPILRAIIVGTPFMVCAQSVGPFRYTTPLARFILNRAAAITVRDAITFDYLRNLDIDTSRVRQTADVAFLLPASGIEQSDKRLRDVGIEPGRSHILGLSISQLVATKFDRRVGADGAFVDLVAAIVGKHAIEHDLQVVLTPHVTGPGINSNRDDRVISRRLRDALPAGIRTGVIKEDLRPEEIKGVIGRCAIFVGTRMHANIAALSSHVPTVAISYSHKTPGIMRACGVEHFSIPVETLTGAQLSELLSEAYAGRQALSVRMEPAIAEQRRLASQNIDTIIELAVGKELS